MSTSTTSIKPPVYFKEPVRWLRFYAHNRPHLFYSVAIGLMGPVFLFGVTPLRRRFLFNDHEAIPLSYPVSDGPRDKNLKGYED